MEEIELGQKTAAGKQRFSPQGRRLGTRFGKVLVWLACYVVVLQSGYFMLKKILALTNWSTFGLSGLIMLDLANFTVAVLVASLL